MFTNSFKSPTIEIDKPTKHSSSYIWFGLEHSAFAAYYPAYLYIPRFYLQEKTQLVTTLQAKEEPIYS